MGANAVAVAVEAGLGAQVWTGQEVSRAVGKNLTRARVTSLAVVQDHIVGQDRHIALRAVVYRRTEQTERTVSVLEVAVYLRIVWKHHRADRAHRRNY